MLRPYLLVLGFTMGCSEGAIDESLDMGRAMTPPTSSDALARFDRAPPVSARDASVSPVVDARVQNMRDRYIPPVRPDAGMLSAEERLSQCVGQMTTFIQNTADGLGCGQFDERDQMNPSSDYNQIRQTAACIQLSCGSTQLEGHNGIPAQRTCSQLNDLVSVLDRALMQALEGGCDEPRFQVRVISLAEFMGGEACDQITCGIDDQGDPITIDNRN